MLRNDRERRRGFFATRIWRRVNDVNDSVTRRVDGGGARQPSLFPNSKSPGSGPRVRQTGSHTRREIYDPAHPSYIPESLATESRRTAAQVPGTLTRGVAGPATGYGCGQSAETHTHIASEAPSPTRSATSPSRAVGHERMLTCRRGATTARQPDRDRRRQRRPRRENGAMSKSTPRSGPRPTSLACSLRLAALPCFASAPGMCAHVRFVFRGLQRGQGRLCTCLGERRTLLTKSCALFPPVMQPGPQEPNIRQALVSPRS
ncbi:hypothetical protein LY78DRAFT_21101 [Colletotrichum sublineola]|nr:hypothetical protein LY78DRAFT_21101 [Colletotrichum sublineola]